MTQVKTGLRGQSVTPEPDSYQKIPLPILEPDATQRAMLEGQRKRYRFRSRSQKYTILLQSTPAHTVDGRLYDGTYMQIHFEPDAAKAGFGCYETDNEDENRLLRASKSFGNEFWDADQRERLEQNLQMEKFLSSVEQDPRLKAALLRRLAPNPEAKSFDPILKNDQIEALK